MFKGSNVALITPFSNNKPDDDVSNGSFSQNNKEMG